VYEIRLHGRGGQGTVTAANLLAHALVEEGRHVVAIPSFGFERRGAPVAAFLRFDDAPIRRMTNIYQPDCVVCIDPTVARAVNIFDGIRENATLVQATRKPLGELRLPERVARIGLCDAVGIALEIFRRPITNTIMLGAFARTTGLVRLESLQAALGAAGGLRDAALEQNLAALARGHEATAVHPIERRAAA
jgi:pyruvate ferredoxin oxidoreductase gamma subunit/phenylglyoxylate dehydrogenase gamma subunit